MRNETTSLLNRRKSYTMNRIMNKKKISLQRRSSSHVSKNVQTRESVVIQVLVPIFNLVRRKNDQSPKVCRSCETLQAPAGIVCFNCNVYARTSSCKYKIGFRTTADSTKITKFNILDCKYVKILLIC